MLCDNCKERDAIVQLTQVAATGTVHLHLCEKCAAEKGVETTVAVPKKHPLGDFLQAVQAQGAADKGDATRCPFCSATLRDFRASGRLGCARCYTAFESSLRDLLRRVHGNSKHVGRKYEPPRPELFERASTLVELRERLQRAIETEQFEVAADLRDKIRVME